MTAPNSHFPTRPDGTATPHLAQRRTEYVLSNPDGSYRMVDRLHAQPADILRTTPEKIVALAAQSLVLRPQYYVGTATHEAAFITNTWETEPDGFVSVGTFQIGAEEAYGAGGFSLVDMLDVTKAAKAFTNLGENHRARILTTIGNGAGGAAEDKPEISALLAAGFNHGFGFLTGWCLQHRNVHDVAALWMIYQQERGPTGDRIVTNKYGVDCVTGGPLYPKPVPVPPVQDVLAQFHAQFHSLQQQLTDFLAKFNS